MNNKNHILSAPTHSTLTPGTPPPASPSPHLGRHPHAVSRDVSAGIPKADLPASNTNGTLAAPARLQFFTNPRILRQVGRERIARFLNEFRSEFEAIGVDLPAPPRAIGSQPCCDEYLAAIASLLSCPDQLPPILIEALQLIENAAAPENYHPCLRPSMLRFAPDEEFNGLCTLAPALTLWFCAPAALSSFPDVSRKIVPAVHTPETKIPNSAATLTELPSAPAQNVRTPDACPVPQDSQNEKSEQSSSACNQNSQIAIQNSDDFPSTLKTTPGLDVLQPVIPWPEPVDGKRLLDSLLQLLTRFVVLPQWAAETLALWIVHTFAFELRDVSTYIGVESPTRRCGKTTLLTLLSQLINRPLVAANVSSPSFFRAIQELKPTLMIDEADRFLKGKNDLQGILNAGYNRKTAYVLRVAQQLPGSSAKGQTSSLAFFSCWCPKVISQIGRLPGTLADRCIVIHMQRKTRQEPCERLRPGLDTTPLRRQCVRFVLDHGKALAQARPELPDDLNDRAADIWEPLLALADLAGGTWPERARQAALHLSAGSQDTSPIGSLLLDIFLVFASTKADRLFTRDLVAELTARRRSAWAESLNGKEATEIWLAKQLRPFAIKPRTLWIGADQGKGYFKADFLDIFPRYISKAEFQALREEGISETPSGEISHENAEVLEVH